MLCSARAQADLDSQLAATMVASSASKRPRLLWEPCTDASATTQAQTFAERLPKTYRTGVATVDQDRELKRKALLSIIRHLWINEQHVFACKSYLENKSEDDRDKVACAGKFKNFGAFGRIDEQWCVQWILNHSKLSMSAIERAKMFDDNAVQQLMTYMLGINACVRLPDACRDIAVASELFQRRASALGDRLKTWKDDAISPNGAIAWSNRGAYDLVWDAEALKVTRIVHRSTKDVADVPPQAPIDQCFNLMANHSDMESFVVYKKISHTLASFFEKDKGPFKVAVWNAKSADLKQAVESVEVGAGAAQDCRRQPGGGDSWLFRGRGR